MKKLFIELAVIGALFLTIGLMIYFPSKPENKIEAEINKRVIKIMTYNQEHASQGTGTLIGHNKILTNAHLFPDTTEQISIVFRRIDETEATSAILISSDTRIDFAILRFNGKDDTKSLPITSQWKLGESIYLMGNPIKGDFIKGHTRLVGQVYLSNPMGYTRALLSFPCDTGAPGFSGSGIWNMKGEYLGTFELSSQEIDLCFAIPAKEIIDRGILNGKPVSLEESKKRKEPEIIFIHN